MKRAANLSVEAELLDRAKALGVNISRALEETLRARIAEVEGARWRKDNARAIDAHNDRVARKGVFSDRLRRF